MKRRMWKGRVDFDLRLLEIFSKVVELKSFSKAAKAVHLAQASVSERIANLEQILGTKLFDRIGREVVPTKVGELLYRRAIKHLEMKRETCLELEEFLGILKGEIEIGGSTIPGEYILPGMITRFRETYENIVVRLTVADSDQICRGVSDGVFELGVVGSKVEIKSLVYQDLWEDELVLVVLPSHRFARKKRVQLEELYDEPFISRESGSGTWLELDRYLTKSRRSSLHKFNVVSQLGSSTAIKEGIKKELGISILSSRAVEGEVEAGILRIVPIDEVSITRSFLLVKDGRRTHSPLSLRFIDFLVATSRT